MIYLDFDLIISLIILSNFVNLVFKVFKISESFVGSMRLPSIFRLKCSLNFSLLQKARHPRKTPWMVPSVALDFNREVPRRFAWNWHRYSFRVTPPSIFISESFSSSVSLISIVFDL